MEWLIINKFKYQTKNEKVPIILEKDRISYKEELIKKIP